MCIKLSQKKFKIDTVNKCKLHYQFILKKFLDYLRVKELSDSYIYRNKRETILFFKYLFKNKIFNVSEITNEIILQYISDLNKYSKENRYNIVSKLKGLFRFMYLYKLTKTDLSIIIPRMPINHNNKIPHTIWSSVDINKILNSVDTTTNIGKRDYAILTIMIYLGLRFVDIKNLKFENIDWKKNIINITQNKTKKYITLPLLNNVGNAIIDYIKNGRPNVDSPYIFLCNKENFSAKYDFSYTFKKYLKLANIDIHDKKYIGTYSLRHSLASTLLQNRTPLSTISVILGHTDINNTDIYLKVDIPSLRECCLDMEVD